MPDAATRVTEPSIPAVVVFHLIWPPIDSFFHKEAGVKTVDTAYVALSGPFEDIRRKDAEYIRSLHDGVGGAVTKIIFDPVLGEAMLGGCEEVVHQAICARCGGAIKHKKCLACPVSFNELPSRVASSWMPLPQPVSAAFENAGHVFGVSPLIARSKAQGRFVDERTAHTEFE